jgi:WD40 repeat protein
MPQLRLMTDGPQSGGHGGQVCTLGFAPDGDFVLSGGWDGHLRLWEVTTGAPVTGLQVSPKAVSACAVAPDARQWLAGGLDGMLSTWDAVKHQRAAVELAHTRPISAILFSADGALKATTSWDRSAIVSSPAGDRERRVLVGHDDIVAGCRFTPDGGHLFSWSHDRTARVWELASGQPSATLIGHSDRVTAGAVSPDGLWAATGARDKVLMLWDLRAERPERSVCLGGEVRACFFLLDGQSLLTIDGQGRVVLHALPDLEERQELQTGQAVQCAELSPSGQLLALGCDDGRVRLVGVEGLDGAELLVTPTQTTHQTQSRLEKFFGRKRVTHAYACKCPACRHAFELPNGSLGQPASCPSCRRSLRLSRVARVSQQA